MRLTGLNIHPVKSTAIRPLTSAEVLPWGLAGDRRWMVVDETSTLVSARELRALFQVTADTPETDPAVTGLRLSAPGREPIDVVEPATAPIDVRMFSNELQGRPADAAADAWLCAATGRSGLRLVWCDDPERRTFARDWARPTDHAPYTDSCPVTLASLASLARLNDWIVEGALERGEEPPAPLPIARFRPNLVIDGELPFAEDGWSQVRVGDVAFRVPKRVDRCVMTTIDPASLDGGKEPIRTLARHRLEDGTTWFAVHLIPEAPGRISLGDEVTAH